MTAAGRTPTRGRRTDFSGDFDRVAAWALKNLSALVTEYTGTKLRHGRGPCPLHGGGGLMNRAFAVICALAGLLLHPLTISGQSTGRADSLRRVASENAAAVDLSGVWDIDGDYKGSDGVFFKASGSFAYVSSTPTSNDDGDVALMSLYLQPMAGGNARWMGVRLYCRYHSARKRTECTPEDGATALLDVNVIVPGLLVRGLPGEVELSEPDSKEPAVRFTSRSSPRGALKLSRPK